jgi:antitoxin ParD1/3/4
LENEESKAIALREAIRAGKGSGIVEDFDPIQNLKDLKAKRGIDA